jgi:hypothetical protein
MTTIAHVSKTKKSKAVKNKKKVDHLNILDVNEQLFPTISTLTATPTRIPVTTTARPTVATENTSSTGGAGGPTPPRK